MLMRLRRSYSQLFFESFPLVFGDIYGFSIGQQGLAFLGEPKLPLGVRFMRIRF